MTFWAMLFKVIEMVERRCTFTAFLTISMTIGFFGFLTLVIFHPPQPRVETVIFSMIAGLSGYVGAIVQYKFGSSSGSTAKSGTIKEALEKKEN